MKNLNIGGLKITLPIIQGGMGVGISLSGLASAVANEGGVGVISPAGIGFLYKKHSIWANEHTYWANEHSYWTKEHRYWANEQLFWGTMMDNQAIKM